MPRGDPKSTSPQLPCKTPLVPQLGQPSHTGLQITAPPSITSPVNQGRCATGQVLLPAPSWDASNSGALQYKLHFDEVH